ncbi:hypothetical protein CONPUDRAFT_151194 [Coniophora puteana RWD-64-598 SS2]|uniref:Uncharacterized protein n=1 Tax=Coniophora puteana (strain RWD-64-598) TaxID=741705 RepID=A0A5M3MYF9_CONPW|nr:uncharacterized protein CONPUDRAFT_151194 [Coniophora puteana RWD-64-598 SS2]EIW84149.1 hypothetical protein CONPUDRAFT_151194 [Coniophora puteana RWD-64-598 SS2]
MSVHSPSKGSAMPVPIRITTQATAQDNCSAVAQGGMASLKHCNLANKDCSQHSEDKDEDDEEVIEVVSGGVALPKKKRKIAIVQLEE